MNKYQIIFIIVRNRKSNFMDRQKCNDKISYRAKIVKCGRNLNDYAIF